MPTERLSFTAVATVAARDATRHLSYWLPALILLAPTLVLQLVAPTYLRTRLAPSPWTVAVGAIALIWLAQVALPAISALVHARRVGTPQRFDWPLARLSLVIGSRVTIGLAAVVLPGLWLQARYAFAPLRGAAAQGDLDTHAAQGRLLTMACVVLLASMLGQSALAAAAEALNTITPAGQVDARTPFQLNYVPHALTTVGAYAWNAATLTFQALCVSHLFEEVHGVARIAAPGTASGVSGWMRAGQVTAVFAALGALVSAIYKVQQHLH